MARDDIISRAVDKPLADVDPQERPMYTGKEVQIGITGPKDDIAEKIGRHTCGNRMESAKSSEMGS